MNDREGEMRDPETGQGGDYEAQAGSSAPVAPTRERRQDPQSSELDDDQLDGRAMGDAGTRQAVDERAATTKTQPMARLDPEQKVAQSHSGEVGSGSLMGDGKWQYFAGRWDSIQSGFVDDPRRTVEQADRLVAEVIDHLAKLFKDERAKLEGQWSQSGNADTEDLRVAMQRYRDFFRTLVGR